ncbi:hypothetical protein XENTR_v10004751 [Xenopus tropicalis]|uniref:Apovitellenin-1 n=1 Tax=Xenopus tropicalis TaxID=8364 RepID=A0A8J0SE98_XENTR|nr:apovitellenin-1 [Xenopus tropicalis]KAE8621288.1 hypothetical protein XENTR_v10004751 [Xenopus tropicalis]|eukprot:XP_012813576.1 PREDICTED: apovitellenin-1-like [Xenopus tropicalis]
MATWYRSACAVALLVVVLIGILGETAGEGDRKGVTKRHIQRGWLALPDEIGTYLYNVVNATSPKAGEMLRDLGDKEWFIEARRLLLTSLMSVDYAVYESYKYIRKIWEP